MSNWDSLILFPLVSLFLVVGYFIVLGKRKVNQFQQWIFILQHFSFWLALSIVLNLNYNFISFDILKDITNLGLILLISSLFYAAIFFIPASWITGLLKSRKIWFYCSYFLIAVAIIILLIFPKNLGALIFAALAFGFGISTNSLWFLFFNEQFLEQSNPFLTSASVLPAVGLAGVTGNSIFLGLKVVITNDAFFHLIIFSVMLVVLLISFGCSFFIKEKKENLGVFDTKILTVISPFKWNKVSIILLLIFSVAILRELSQGDLLNLIIAQNLNKRGFGLEAIQRFLHFSQQIWWIAQGLGAILIYPLVVKKVGIKNSLIGAFAIWAGYFLLIGTIQIPELYLVLQILNGFILGALLGILFSLIIMWNSRVKNRPITGFFSAINAFSGFIVQFGIHSAALKQIGIFNGVIIDWNMPIANFNLEILKTTVIILFVSLTVITVLLVILVYFTGNYISGEFANQKKFDHNVSILMKQFNNLPHSNKNHHN
ncbi:MFS transporter [Spiroplasma chrysopicola]|uniref:MFS transporter n=1 Tax=Spiroplasma chrysopicola DF-1 TaxID=1276227 RepID=R4U2L6_9MOLU|nr:hypothetical protein [Spiroplasma chrysopicola]AGM24693.1 hypothetical protein SCHRY_v1c01060 [Spiroplasma chrysopicola DF-1]